ncbi:MAG: (4Fe-4S)-binding protein [Nitrososphaera sp.]|uniref:(4Fe-4S)-binding protein n=1 Tax=Nitrososphaera sp. TaxID=1971748 RepID=UPI003D6F55DA
MSKPKIILAPNGPLYLVNDPEPAVVENLVDTRGAPLATVRRVALCRCGQSRSKPFCDGTHSAAGFSSDNSLEVPDRRKDYVGRKGTVHDNRSICSHAGKCVAGLPAVFRLDKLPWVDPEAATMQEVIDTVRKCPSGALIYSVDGVEYRDLDGKPQVKVVRNGPYHVTGGIELVGAKWAQGASKEHYALPLRRVKEQAVLRRHAPGSWLYGRAVTSSTR